MYDDMWETPKDVHCYTCDWEGTADELEVGEDDFGGWHYQYPECPKCNRGTIEYD